MRKPSRRRLSEPRGRKKGEGGTSWLSSCLSRRCVKRDQEEAGWLGEEGGQVDDYSSPLVILVLLLTLEIEICIDRSCSCRVFIDHFGVTLMCMLAR